MSRKFLKFELTASNPISIPIDIVARSEDRTRLETEPGNRGTFVALCLRSHPTHYTVQSRSIHYPPMSFGWGVGDILAISGLAVKVYTAYKDAPDDYRHISDEVKSLQIIVNKAATYFQSTTLDNNSRQEGQEVLRGCQNVLEDLNSLIEKYNSLASVNKVQILKRVKLGTEDIATLRARLISNIGLLNGFIQSCEFLEMQARLTDVLGLHRTSTRVSIDSVASFAGSGNTKKAYKKFCRYLFQIGVTSEMISQKEAEILDIFKLQGTAIRGLADNGNIADRSQLPAKQSRFGWVRPPMDSLVGPLMLSAAETGNAKRVISTLRYMRNINFEDEWKETALHKAAERGHKDIIQLLLDKGATTEAMDKDRETPLHLAAREGHTDTVGLLLAKGASIEALNYANYTPLHIAAWSGHSRVVEILLEKGASIEATDIDTETPLHLAVRNDHTDTVGLLLARGASTEALNHTNNTPLHLAAWLGYSGTAQKLLDKCAATEVPDKDRETPLHLAAREGHTDIVRLLLAKGASIEALNHTNHTPLHLAAWNGHAGTAERLLDSCASTEAMDEDGATPLHLAARNGHTNTVGVLLGKGASIEATNTGTETPLHLAAWNGHTSVIELLLRKGTSIKAMDEDIIPLHSAARRGHTDTV